MSDIIDHIISNSWVSVSIYLSFLGHMASCTCHAICKTPPSLSTSVAPNCVLSRLTVHEHHSDCLHKSNIVPVMLEKSLPGMCQCSLPCLCTGQADHYWHIHFRLGSPHGQPYSTMHLDFSRVQEVHQCSRAASSLKGLQSLSPDHSKSPCPHNIR